MENRWSQRTPIQVDLIVHYGPLGLIRATTRDMSKDGMFIQTGRIILSPEEIVEITFSSPSLTEGVTFSMPANVVYSCAHGSGIQFINQTLDESIFFPEVKQKRAAAG